MRNLMIFAGLLLVGVSLVLPAQNPREEHIVGIEAVPAYDGTPNFFLVVDFWKSRCGWATDATQGMRAEWVGDRLRISLYPLGENPVCTFAEPQTPARYLIPMVRLLDRDQVLPASMTVETVIHDRGTDTISASIRLHATPRSDAPIALETGIWDGLYESPMTVDRRATTVDLNWVPTDLGYPGSPAYSWVVPGRARSWVATGIQSREFLRASLTELSPQLVTEGGESVIGRFPRDSVVGDVLIAIASPNRMLVSMPNGEQFESRRRQTKAGPVLITASGRHHYLSPMDGEWHWIGSRPSILRGQRLRFSSAPSQYQRTPVEWRFQFNGGGGRLVCGERECTLFASNMANSPESPVERIQLIGLGEDKMHVRDTDGRWQAIAFRAE